MPAPPRQRRSNLADICEAIKDRLVAITEFPSERVIWWYRRNGELPNFQGMNTIVMRIRQAATVPGPFEAADVFDTRCQRVLDITPMVKVARDTTKDDAWAYATDGYFPLEGLIIQALLGWIPVDEDDNILTADAPIRLATLDEATNFPDRPGWGEGGLTFTFTHQPLTSLDL